MQGYEPPHRNKQGTATWETPTTNTALGDTWTSILSAHGACTCDLDLSWVSGVSVGIRWRVNGGGSGAGPDSGVAQTTMSRRQPLPGQSGGCRG